MTTNSRVDDERRDMLHCFLAATEKEPVYLCRGQRVYAVWRVAVFSNSMNQDALLIEVSTRRLADGVQARRVESLREFCYNARIVSKHEAFFLSLEGNRA